MKRRVVLLVSLFVAIVVSAQSVGQKWLADARKGNVRAMVQTGKSYYTGTNGLPQNKTKALYWFEKAANAGNTEAMLMVAQFPGVNGWTEFNEKRKNSQYLKWAEKAAAKGSAEGQMITISNYQSLADWSIENNSKRMYLSQCIYWCELLIKNTDMPTDYRYKDMTLDERNEMYTKKLLLFRSQIERIDKQQNQ